MGGGHKAIAKKGKDEKWNQNKTKKGDQNFLQKKN